MSHDHDVRVRKKRAPLQGLSRDALNVYQHRPRDNYVREPMSIAEAFAVWLDSIGWVIDAPFPQNAIGDIDDQIATGELPLHRLDVKEPGVPAEFMKNVFWGLTFEDLFSESSIAESLIGFTSDGGTIDLRSRDRTLYQRSIVRVLADSLRPRTAMDVAMRLWDLFRERPGFSVQSTRLNQNNGERVQVRRPDFSVRQAKLLDEPTFLAIGAEGERSQVTFRLMVDYVRF